MLNAVKPSPRKIAVLTFHTAYNCGAHLQAWALQTVLRRLGFEPTFPDCTKVGYFRRFDPIWYKQKPEEGATWFARKWFAFRQELGALGVEDLKRHRFRMFAKRALTIKAMSVKDIERDFASIIVGSDQVWNHLITRTETDYYRTTLFAGSTPRRYTYAVSMGDAVPSVEAAGGLAAAARRFENLSVRENLLPELVDRHGNGPVVDPDPTLLLTQADFARIACPRRLVKGRYLFVYSLGYNAKTWAVARTMAREMGVKVVFALVYQYGTYRMADARDVDIGVSPDRFLAYVRDAEAVITSSFHGTALSLVYGKRFATLPHLRGKVSLRCSRLLHAVQEEIHRIDNPDELDSVRRALSADVRPETREALRGRARRTVERLAKILPNVERAPRETPRPRHPAFVRPFAKAWGGVRCLRENGVKYTVRHSMGKLLRFAGIRSAW